VTYSNNNGNNGNSTNGPPGNSTNGPPNNNTNIPPITVSVSDSYGAGWSISWSGAASGSHSGSSTESFKVWPASNGTVYFTAEVTSNPSGYECTISPENTQANPGGTASFTVNCKPTPQYYCYVSASAYSNLPNNAGGPSVNPTSATLSPGQSRDFKFSAALIVYVNSTKYNFSYWLITVVTSSGSSNSFRAYDDPYTYTYTCPANLNENLTVTITGIATYTSSSGGSC
jgi:hypothetical protein